MVLKRSTQHALAVALMMASGFAGLGYQIVWTQQSALWLGHDAAAVLAVVAAFFGGLSLGALALGARIEHSARPARWYAACEAVIGLWGLVLMAIMPRAAAWLLDLTGARPAPAWQWAVAFAGTFAMLLPATAAMGATLPAMERVMASWRQRGTTIGALYAANTVGAVLGVLAAAFWLVPGWGLRATASVCVALNLACAALGLMLASAAPHLPKATRAAVHAMPARRLVVTLAATGLLGIGYEVLVVRVLCQVAENTVYTFALLLAVYLLGTAAGAAAHQRWLASTDKPDAWRERLILAMAAACLLGSATLWGADGFKAAVSRHLVGGMASALIAEAALAVAAFLLPTFVMGALFSHLCVLARFGGVGFGRSLGVNTLGATAAALVFGVLLLPAIGAKLALLAVAAGYLALLSSRAWRGRAAVVSGGLAVTLGMLAWLAPPLVFVEVPEGGRLVSYREGTLAAVSVVEDSEGVLRLRIDNRQQEGDSASLLADGRQAVLPLLLHPAPRRALFLGLGTGVTASTAAAEAGIEVDAVELLPEVVEASAHFTRLLGGGVPNPRLHVAVADARRFVRLSEQRYDVVVADNFHPARSGSGSLYTVEHFLAVKGRLSPGGLFCQWLPLHQMDLDTLRSVVRSFTAVYPQARAVLATNSLETPVVGLVGLADDALFDLQRLRDRLARAALPRGAAEFGFPDDLSLLGNFFAGPAALARFAVGAPLNTDDQPVVAYRAPRITYAPDSRPRDRLLALLRETSVAPADLVDPSADAAWMPRLTAYLQARNRFLEVGRDIVLLPDAQRMLQQVRAPLLGVLRISPDFRPAYDPLLTMAGALAMPDPVAARELLTELASVQPTRVEAPRALLQLGGMR